MRPLRDKAWILSAAALAVAGCSSTPTPPLIAPVAPPPVVTLAAPEPASAQTAVAAPDLTARQRMLQVLQLLGNGKAVQARAEVVQFLQEQPGNALGKSLLEQIDRDPKELLGAKSFTYRTQPGETLSSIAEKFLGDRLLFYALARYNGLAAPSQMEVGQVLQIPGTAPRAAPRRAPRAASDEAAVEARVAESRPTPKPVPPPSGPRRDPQGAARLRQSALDKMQAGSIDAAVRLFEQALQLDPDSVAIKADLERSRRIQATVRKR